MAERKTPLDQEKRQWVKATAIKMENYSRSLRKIIIAAGIFVLIAGITGATVGLIFISDAPDIDRAALETVQTSYLYDKTTKKWQPCTGRKPHFVSLADIPDHVQKAFIAIEDERFEKHFGWDIIGFMRAYSGEFAHPQLHPGRQHDYPAAGAERLPDHRENHQAQNPGDLAGDQIRAPDTLREEIRRYLNRIYFGNGAYGVEAAAQTYFNKSVGELDLHEAAYLAAIVRSPVLQSFCQ